MAESDSCCGIARKNFFAGVKIAVISAAFAEEFKAERPIKPVRRFIFRRDEQMNRVTAAFFQLLQQEGEHFFRIAAFPLRPTDDDPRKLLLRTVADLPDVYIVVLVFGNDRRGGDGVTVFLEYVQSSRRVVRCESFSVRIVLRSWKPGKPDRVPVQKHDGVQVAFTSAAQGRITAIFQAHMPFPDTAKRRSRAERDSPRREPCRSPPCQDSR